MASQPERIVLTYEDYLQLPTDRNRYEIFEGEVQVSAAPNIAHQTAVTNLGAILGNHIRSHRLGQVLVAPTDVVLSEVTVVQPDILFVSAERRKIIQAAYVGGAPDLVIEVLSPSTALADRHAKQQIYARHGVPHYWRFDPERREAIGLALDAEGRYRSVAFAEADAEFSAAPFSDLVISLSEIWQ